MPADLYVVLGVEPTASQDEVKQAYRQIARKYHPDKNPGDDEAERIFTQAAEAYQVLGDTDLRAQYDRYRAGRGKRPDSDRSARRRRSPGDRGGAHPADDDIFSDIFGRRRAGMGGRAGSRSGDGSRSRRMRGNAERGADLRYTLELDFEDAAIGCERSISVPRQARCASCGGTGARAGTTPMLCQGCGGVGEVREEEGLFAVTRACPQCSGTGKLIPESCPECRGRGTTETSRALTVNVPPGVDEGTRLRMAGEGETGKGGGPSGDLFVVVQIRPHPFFRREDDDIVAEVPVRFPEAALGATIEVPTLEGKVRMRVPAGSQSGRVFRLKGKGVPLAKGRGRGDQRVRIVVEIPTHVSPEQRDLLERYNELEDEHHENPMVRDYLALMDEYYAARES